MKNSLRRIAALLMAVMMLAALGMSVSAVVPSEDTNGISTVEFTKTLTKEVNAYAPKTTYTFTIAAGTAVNAGAGQAAVYAGDLALVAFVPAASQAIDGTNDDKLIITSTPADADIGETELVYNCQIQIADATGFVNPGIYRYTVTESDGGYAGVTYATTAHTLDVYITSDENNALSIAGYALYETDDSTKVDDFANDYDTADLTVSKAVTGNQGDRNKTFDITVEITGVADEQYYILKGTAPQTITAGTDGKASATIALANGEEFTVYGLSETDSYKVTETSYAADGYTTKVSVNGAEATEGLEGTGTIAEAADVVDATVAFTNDKNVTVPTGIVMTVLPFVAMVLIAAVVAVIFFKRRERREA